MKVRSGWELPFCLRIGELHTIFFERVCFAVDAVRVKGPLKFSNCVIKNVI